MCLVLPAELECSFIKIKSLTHVLAILLPLPGVPICNTIQAKIKIQLLLHTSSLGSAP